MKTKIGMNMVRTNPFSPSLPVAAITRFQKQPLLQTSLKGLNSILILPTGLPDLPKAPEGWRTPRRYAWSGVVEFAPASWTAAALRRFSRSVTFTPLHRSQQNMPLNFSTAHNLAH
jgi:hypothetical protein